MKLPIKKLYFDLIKAGKKDIELRDAHITFVCEETKREMRVEVEEVDMVGIGDVSPHLKQMFTDNNIIRFFLKQNH